MNDVPETISESNYLGSLFDNVQPDVFLEPHASVESHKHTPKIIRKKFEGEILSHHQDIVHEKETHPLLNFSDILYNLPTTSYTPHESVIGCDTIPKIERKAFDSHYHPLKLNSNRENDFHEILPIAEEIFSKTSPPEIFHQEISVSPSIQKISRKDFDGQAAHHFHDKLKE